MISEFVDAGKAVVGLIQDLVAKKALLKMVVVFEREIHRLTDMITTLTKQIKYLNTQAKARDAEIEDLKARNFGLLRDIENNERRK